MTKFIRAAIVGCNSIAQVHARAIASAENAELVACADINTANAQKLMDKFGNDGNVYASLDDMLDGEEIDVLHVCTPHYLHVPMIKAGVARGIAVFSEKPPAISREQWAELMELPESARIGICFQNRFNDTSVYLKKLVSSEAAGATLGARGIVTWDREEPYYVNSGWRGKLSSEGGGALMNQSIHTLDLILWLLGAPTSVRASAHNHHLGGVIEVEDTLEAFLDYGGGKRALFYASNAYVTNAPVTLEVVCENFTARTEGNSVTVSYTDGRVENIFFPASIAAGKGYWGASHDRAINEFYSALRENRPFPIGLRDVETTVDTMLSIYERCRKAHE